MKYNHRPLILLLLLFILSVCRVSAQSQIRKGNRHYDRFEYSLAIESYLEGIQEKEPTLETAQRLADSYRLTSRTEQAENWYAKVLKFENPDPGNYFYYAEMLRANGKYAEARAQYLNFGTKAPAENATAMKLVESVDRALLWLKRPPSAEVRKVAALNTANADFSPSFYKNGIVFTSDRGTGVKGEKIYGWTGRPYLKLYSSTQTNDTAWSAPTLLPATVNTEYHNGPATTMPDSRMMFFTRTKLVKVKDKSINNDPTDWTLSPNQSEYINRLEIFMATRRGDQWVQVKPFQYNKVEEYSVGHTTLSPDGQTLYFASDMPGGLGDTDIYYSQRITDSTWTQPVNAGPVINTAGKEEFPTIAPNGTLYFASDRHPGFGGLDIFSAKGSLSTWTGVTNMYAPLNSPKDDYGIMLDSTGRAGLFSSNRASNMGTSDIFAFNLLLKPAIIAVTTLERRQNAQARSTTVPLPDVRLKLNRQGSPDSTVALSGSQGKYNFEVRKGFNYSIFGTKDGFLTQSRLVVVDTTAASDTIRVTLTFDRMNRPIVLENIYFDLDKYNIRPDAAFELDKLVQVLKDNPRIKIEMGAHCDSRESPKYNQVLSENRAKATVNYLVSKGIGRSRLTAKGYGESRHVKARCYDGVECSETEHQANRRTEFKIRQ